jgi:hypothetical protein
VGVAGCKEHGVQPPESSIAPQNRRSGPVRPDPNRLMKEALREKLAAKLRARGHGPEEALALAREAIPDDQNLGEIYPGDDTPLWEKTPEELQEELRQGLEEAGLPPPIHREGDPGSGRGLWAFGTQARARATP